jgi:hypothetical protein
MSVVGWLVGWTQAGGAVAQRVTDLEADVATNTADITALQNGAISLFSAHATGGMASTAVGAGAIVLVPLSTLVGGDQFPAVGWALSGGVVTYTAALAGLYEITCTTEYTIDVSDIMATLEVVEGTDLAGTPTIRGTLTDIRERSVVTVEATQHVSGFMRLNAGGGQIAVRVLHDDAGSVNVAATIAIALHRVNP